MRAASPRPTTNPSAPTIVKPALVRIFLMKAATFESNAAKGSRLDDAGEVRRNFSDAPVVTLRSATVVIADECEVLRVGLRHALESRLGYIVAEEVGEGHAALRSVMQLRPNLLLIDTHVSGLLGNEVVACIASAGINTRVLAFTAYADRFSIIRMLRSGVCGYVLKSASMNELLRAAEVVMRGSTYLSPKVAGIVSGLAIGQGRGSDLKRPEDLLSFRETEVLQAITSGKQNKEIAAELAVNVRTIESHRLRIMNKLNLRSVAALTKYAIREGLASIES